MIIGYLRPSLYLCLMAIVWSGVSASMCGTTNFTGLVLVRFFLGVVEAPLLPGAVYLMGCWYTRREMAMRVAILYTGQTLAFCTAGLIAAAVFGTLDQVSSSASKSEDEQDTDNPLQKYGVAGWKWLFIVLAVCGTGLALIALFLLPDYPHSQTGSAMWTMTEDMRKIAAARIAADRVSTSEAKSGVWEGLKMAIFDWKMVLLVALNIGISAAYGFSNFFPSIVRGFGYSNVVSLLLTCPPYIFAAIGSLINAWHSDRTSERGYHICLSTMNGGARYGASFLYVGGMYTANPLISTWVSSTMGRTPENRAIAVALCNVLGQIGNVIAPYFFRESDNPRYQLAFILMMVCAVVAISATTGLKFHLKYLNKKLYQKSLLQGTVYQPYVT
jgi:sugar phosphate permease